MVLLLKEQQPLERHHGTEARSRVPFRPIIRRTILSSSDGIPLIRQGVQTSVIPQIDVESQGNKVLSRALIPFMRSKNVHFKATGMKPLTRVYPFFDKTPVSQYCVPVGGAVTGTRSTLAVNTSGSWTSISRVEFDYLKKVVILLSQLFLIEQIREKH